MDNPINPRVRSFLRVIMADIPYFMKLATKKQGRGSKGIEISRLPGYRLSHFYVLPQPKRILFLVHDESFSDTYVVEFMEDLINVSNPSTPNEEGSHIGIFRYADIAAMPTLENIDLVAIQNTWQDIEPLASV